MSIALPTQLHHRVLMPENGQDRRLPLVLLHGLMGFSANWGKIWPLFQEDRPVLVLDQRGHGRSVKPPDGYGPTDYAQDLAALLAHLGWSQCHVVGHSMGGRVALRFASLYPEITRTLTLEDSGTEANPSRVDWIKRLLGSVPTPFREKEGAKKFFEENFRHDPMTGSFLHANLETKEDGSIDWRFHQPGMVETILRGRATDASAEFAALAAPTLLIRGALSREFPEEEARRMAKARPGVELVEIADAGHYVHAEKPREFSAALKDFIERNER